MGRKRLYASDGDRRRAQTARRSHARSVGVPEFIGVDGEGITNSHGDHVYVLLSVGTVHLQNVEGLTFTEICRFLYSCYLDNPSAVFGGYFLSYDWCQWLKTLPADRAWMLLSDKGKALRARKKSGGNRKPFPVRYAGWEFDMLGFKRFKLRPEGSSQGWMYINDCGTYFQTSFLAATDPDRWTIPILSMVEYAILAAGKERRATAVLDSEMLEYNGLENIAFSRLMGPLARGFADCGINLRRDQWYGPGQAAQKWLNNINASEGETIREIVPERVLDLARESYYGGWFEIFAHGHIPGTSYEYDINSAYPHVIAGLPCLLHGTWHRTNRLDNTRYQLVSCKTDGSDPHIGAMLHRMPDGCIRRPLRTEGVYWAHEIEAAQKAGLIDTIEIEECWSYEPCDCLPPLRGVVGLYDQRLSVGKDTPQGKALKLLINSLYGKFAQSVGDPRYANALYASLITSGCRTMLLNAIALHPRKSDAVVMIATDGIYFTEPHPTLPLSKKLGDWDVSQKENLTLFKPGVYWDDNTRQRIRNNLPPSFKARGINARAFAGKLTSIDDWFAKWGDTYPRERDPMGENRSGWFPRVTFDTDFAMVTATQAIAWGRWEDCGRVGHADTHPSGCGGCHGAHLVQDSDPIGKRHSGWYDAQRDIYWSEPYPDGGHVKRSTVYSKRFGDVPEWGDTPDGSVVEGFAWLLGIG
jgi:hypothetical protein